MTLGAKVKEARKRAGLSQEQLAEKMGVSRSAVAKWETGNGIPDIDNLKILSRLLGVTIDYLVDDGENFDKVTIKEAIDLSKYAGSKREKKDTVVREKYPTATIYPLLVKEKLKKSEKVFSELLAWLTDAPSGTAEVLHDIRNADDQYYLAEQEDKRFLVCVTSEFIVSCELAQKQKGNKFEIDNLKFTKCTYKVK